MTTKTLSVPDISCEHCERAIKGALEPLAGVRTVAVDIPGKTVRVQYDEAAVSIERITRAVEEEDYPVTSVA
jgi:copper chaperone CopZ